jgi:hypothetical protein
MVDGHPSDPGKLINPKGQALVFIRSPTLAFRVHFLES